MNKRLTVAVTGASGALYAVRLLRYLMMHEFEVDFIVSDAGKITFKLNWMPISARKIFRIF